MSVRIGLIRISVVLKFLAAASQIGGWIGGIVFTSEHGFWWAMKFAIGAFLLSFVLMALAYVIDGFAEED